MEAASFSQFLAISNSDCVCLLHLRKYCQAEGKYKFIHYWLGGCHSFISVPSVLPSGCFGFEVCSSHQIKKIESPLFRLLKIWLRVFLSRNKLLCLSSSTAVSVIFFRCIEAMYGTSPEFVELSMSNYCGYYGNLVRTRSECFPLSFALVLFWKSNI